MNCHFKGQFNHDTKDNDYIFVVLAIFKVLRSCVNIFQWPVKALED
jgi:hypothetical protein